jgi:hypothetical protein
VAHSAHADVVATGVMEQHVAAVCRLHCLSEDWPASSAAVCNACFNGDVVNSAGTGSPAMANVEPMSASKAQVADNRFNKYIFKISKCLVTKCSVIRGENQPGVLSDREVKTWCDTTWHHAKTKAYPSFAAGGD